MKLSGKTALITGGNSGIGFESAKAFLREGAKVIITGRSEEKLKEAVILLGGDSHYICQDISQIETAENLYSLLAVKGFKIDILFANAGIAENNIFGETSLEQFNNTFDTNVKGMFFTVQALLPLIKNGGRIILNASIVANKGMPNLSLYNASKAAVRSFARSWCNDLKDREIRVNAISPGITLTPIMKKGLEMDDESIKAFAEHLKLSSPIGRFGDPAETANAVLFLASDDSSYVNGIELSVDGGYAQI